MKSASPTATLEGGSLRVTGDVDAVTVMPLRKQGEKLINEAKASLTVDLSGLAAANSVVLSMLMCWQRLALSQQQALSFEGASDRLRSLAALSNLEHQLPGFARHS
ncbi:lipid asymmetry maintenance protein MlaB [Marinobacter sp. SS5-14b]|uniref:STAS domain-containing protein n=1 Tax=Marinobacter sp. SS5-14b TaxID=3050456 RepID=UPI0026E1117F|nr:STAS domain-containing protein [Marinobacter sp. SS5-14b]